MGDKATLAKARKELEELYLGVPDDSVNLTFQDLAEVRQHKAAEKRRTTSSTSPSSPPVISEKSPKSSVHLAKLPSIDFNKALEASFQSNHNNNIHNYSEHHENHHHHMPPSPFNHEGASWGPHGHDVYGHEHHHHAHAITTNSSHHRLDHGSLRHGDAGDQRSMVYDDMSHVSGISISSVAYERRGRRRPGIPHSNICTVCSSYIYICRHRCLVCGRVYCRQCVSIGMGEMTEGRKCVDCLGRRFSQRYMQKAGNVGCCLGYPSAVKQQELKWAEKGPRRSGGGNRYGGGGGQTSMLTSASRSPVIPHSINNSPNSFVMGSPYSPTNHHPLPF